MFEPWIISLLGGVVCFIGAFVFGNIKGRRDNERKHEHEKLTTIVNTVKRMDNADVSSGNTTADAKWMQQRAKSVNNQQSTN